MKKSKWTRAQIDLLVEKAKAGNIRTTAFEEVARKTNRKPNSIRNYYYKHLAKEKARFLPFSPSEIKNSLREIILGTSRDESVRSICLRLAEGDKTKMLRFQNKYRTILRTQPQKIEQIKNQLEQQGYLVKSPVPSNIVTLPVRPDKKLSDNDINNLFLGLMRLIKKQAEEGVKTQVENLKSEIERLKTHPKITK
jgi:hypothetical protein